MGEGRRSRFARPSPWLKQQFDEAVAAAEQSLDPAVAGV